MNKSFFWKKASGLKADIARHKEKIKDIESRLEVLETKESRTKKDESSIRICRNFLYILHNSMAEVTNLIGRKKV